MARHLARVGPFDVEALCAAALDGHETRDLMQCADRIADAFEAHLPGAFPQACTMMRAAFDPGVVAQDWQATPDDDDGIRGVGHRADGHTRRAAQNVMIDNVVHFTRANGSLAPKAFKWPTAVVEPGRAATFETRHKLRAVMTRPAPPNRPPNRPPTRPPDRPAGPGRPPRGAVQLNGGGVASAGFGLID